MGRLVRLARKGLGALLLLPVLLPLPALLDPSRAGPAASATRSAVEPVRLLSLWGTLSLLLLGALLTVLLSAGKAKRTLARWGRVLTRPDRGTFALGLGGTSFVLGVVVSLKLHRTLPRLLDGMVQLLHARVFAEGRLASSIPSPTAARLVQNGLLVPEGWVSVYPPGHTVLLAAGHLVGAPWLVGPLLLGGTAAFTFLAVARLFPERPATTRLAGVAVAVSPFLLFLGSGYLSHVSVAAASALTLYLAVRARDGTAAWAILAGLAASFAVTARPWSGLLLGAVLSAGLWADAWWWEGRPPRWLAARLGLGGVGALPLGGLLLAYDSRLFGGPFRLGYELAFGPTHRLGFHPDPWGNVYGLREAVGYTGADLAQLGLHLFETPLSAVVVVGAFLLLAPRLSVGTRVLASWALVPVAGNFFYWHHGLHMGPRMLLEAGPGWAALSAVSVVALVDGCRDPGVSSRIERGWRHRVVPGTVLWATLVAILAAGVLLPDRVEAYRWSEEAAARSVPPTSFPKEPAVVFVHGSWAGRVAARLSAAGMRRDSVETALRRNGLCEVYLHTLARERGEVPRGLDLTALPGTPPGLEVVEIGGTPVRVNPALRDPGCEREARADRFGVVELAPLLWQTPLPASGGHPLFFRDLGPELNDRILEHYPDRVPYLLTPATDGRPVPAPYREAVRRLWEGGAAPVSGQPGRG